METSDCTPDAEIHNYSYLYCRFQIDFLLMNKTGFLFFAFLFFGMIPDNPEYSHFQSQDENFCNKLKILVESSRDGFYTVKGDSVTKIVTGAKKKFYLSKIKLHPKNECYINDNEKYPECNCILASDFSITPALKKEFQNYKSAIVSCFPESDWIITQKDSSNDFYLKGTDFKRLILVSRNAEKKVKFSLYMYSSMIEKKRIVEVLIEGRGKTNEKKEGLPSDSGKPKTQPKQPVKQPVKKSLSPKGK
ncbi:MAG: hypothetical protein HYY40_08455 [Bacteroidetes bacterium]|nr:hypothetical protein [Bacteroidota bacterium]